MYQALGYPLPQFAHIPLILGQDKSKLSKRHAAVAVMSYQENGFLPEALVNFLARLDEPWGSGDFTQQELNRKFYVEGVGKASGYLTRKNCSG
jgi:glutamyl-tRNA synthetase